jgi:hypothetical protein
VVSTHADANWHLKTFRAWTRKTSSLHVTVSSKDECTAINTIASTASTGPGCTESYYLNYLQPLTMLSAPTSRWAKAFCQLSASTPATTAELKVCHNRLSGSLPATSILFYSPD